MAPEPVDDEVLQALDALTDAVRDNNRRNAEVLARADKLRHARATGAAWSDLVSESERPLIVELLTQNMTALATAGSRLRRLEARVLHDEGLSMERIASLFGVTRQRISELLREPS